MPSHILVVGSLAYDDVHTPYDSRREVLGGAASYFSLAACLYAPVRLMGVVGDDFRGSDLERFRAKGVDLALDRRRETRGHQPWRLPTRRPTRIPYPRAYPREL